MERTCTIEGCDRKLFARGWCAGHYNRVRRTGELGDAPLGTKRTGCLVEGGEKKHRSLGYCYLHLYRVKSNGDPLVTRRPISPVGEAHPNWCGEEVSYAGLHRRLAQTLGPARHRDCIECGRRANEWAYQYSAVDEKACDKTGAPYSTDLDDYQPMCITCHRRMDARHGFTNPRMLQRGASLNKKTGRWRAYARFDGRQYTNGSYLTRDEALVAAHELRQRLWLSDE